MSKKMIVLAMAMMISASGQSKGGEQIDKVVSQVNFSQVKVKDAFWSPRLDRLFTATLPVCIDQIEHKIENL